MTDLEAALNRIKAKTYIMPFKQDMFFTVESCQYERDDPR